MKPSDIPTDTILDTEDSKLPSETIMVLKVLYLESPAIKDLLDNGEITKTQAINGCEKKLRREGAIKIVLEKIDSNSNAIAYRIVTTPLGDIKNWLLKHL